MKRLTHNQQGFITADFIFAFTLVFAMFMICFAVSLTLSMIEVAQYLTFATARTYWASHITPDEQNNLAMEKYQNLSAKKPFKGLFFNGSGYFSLSAQPTLGDFNSDYPQDPSSDRLLFVGARSQFRAKILELGTTYFGDVQSPDGKGFLANISTYLNREPTTSECETFNEQRLNALKQLNTEYQKAKSGTNYAIIGDNGC